MFRRNCHAKNFDPNQIIIKSSTMAFNATKTPLLKSILARGFSAQASQKFASSKANELQTTTLTNNILVASIDQNAPLANVAVIYGVGARNESPDTQGITRALRIGARLSNKSSTDFHIRQSIRATGGALSANCDRETFTYSIQLNRNQLDNGLRCLYDVSTQQEFRPWELKGLADKISDDLLNVTNTERAIDALHQAAFNGGLSNTLYAGNVNIGNITASQLQSFVEKNFNASRCAIVGVGVDHETLLGFAKAFELETGTVAAAPCKSTSGQVRINQSGSNTTVAVGTQGASLANAKEVLAFTILRNIAGNGKLIAHCGPVSALAKVVDGSLKSPYEFDAISANYTDNGLFGFVLTANAQEVAKAVESALKALKSGSVSQGDVDVAKAILKATVAEQLATSAGRFSNLLSQASTGQILGKSEILAAIDGVSVADVNAAAKKVASGKWSIGAIGNLANVPYAADLN